MQLHGKGWGGRGHRAQAVRTARVGRQAPAPGRRRSAAALAALVTLAFAAPASAQSSVAGMQDCVERRGFVPADATRVRARVPARYELVRDRGGQPLLVVQILRCASVEIDGTSAPATLAQVLAVIVPPDGRGCGQRLLGAQDPTIAATFAQICAFYVISWASDSGALIAWLERGTPEIETRVVPSLAFDAGQLDPAALGMPFSGEAPAPAEWSFSLAGVARERRGPLPLAVSFWVPTSGGQLRVAAPIEAELGEASGTVATPAGSELAELLGAESRPFAQGYSQFGGNRWAGGEYVKTVVPD